MPQPLLVITATPDRDSGLELVKSSVAQHLAASGQVVHAETAFWHRETRTTP